MEFRHQPVMKREVLHFLAPKDGGLYVDATVGGGGHARAILEASAPSGRLLGIDRDPDAIEAATEQLAEFGDRVVLVHGRYRDLPAILDEHAFGHELGPKRLVDGILVDAGVSSYQLSEVGRGFSFMEDGPLDMRMSKKGLTAGELIEALHVEDLARVLAEYGEVPHPRRVARIMRDERVAGRLETTRQLADLAARVIEPVRQLQIHPATLVFQALRIAVNEEIEDLARIVEVAPDHLVDLAVAVFVAFHSVEDRVVKLGFKNHARIAKAPRGVPLRESELPGPTMTILTLRPMSASDAERTVNRRARSAKLRAAQRLPRPKSLEQGGQNE